MANAKKKCRHCKIYNLVESGIKVPLGWFCSMACVVQHGKKAAVYASEKRKRESDTKLRATLKTASEWRIEAQSAFNAYVRHRDRHLSCISCDSMGEHHGLGGYWDAGHYRSRGSAKHLSFNLHNCAKQCHRCNRYLSGNVVDYRIKLVKRIGLEKVEALENNNAIVKHDIKYLRRIKQIFKAKLRLSIKLSEQF
jgi:hypothetical protein|tara:strand:+ start:819 stop:1403 length:585 start_codon:yes stop_codon:yes gene_type:complete